MRTPRPSAGPDSIVGDWFFCEDLECYDIDDEGISFTADGRVWSLDAPGGDLEPDEAYCARFYFGTYRLLVSGPDDLLELTPVRGGPGARVYQPLVWSEHGRRLTFPSFETSEEGARAVRISPSRLVSDCDRDVPVPGVPPPG